MFRFLKSANVSNRSEDGHSNHNSYAGQLHHVSCLCMPALTGTQAPQCLVHVPDMLTDQPQGLQFLFQPQSFQLTQRQLLPPFSILSDIDLSFGCLDIMAMQEAVQAVL